MSRPRVGIDPDLVSGQGYLGAELAAWELPNLHEGQVLDVIDVTKAANCTNGDFYPATVKTIQSIPLGRRIAWLSK